MGRFPPLPTKKFESSLAFRAGITVSSRKTEISQDPVNPWRGYRVAFHGSDRKPIFMNEANGSLACCRWRRVRANRMGD